MLCRVLSLLCVGVSPGLVPVKVDVNQCVILFIILQQLLLTYQLKINKSFIHSFNSYKTKHTKTSFNKNRKIIKCERSKKQSG